MDPPLSPFSSQEEQDEIVRLALSPETLVLDPLPPSSPPAVAPPDVSSSAFVGYAQAAGRSSSLGGAMSAYQRVIEFQRTQAAGAPENEELQGSRGFRHLMRERLRRERLSKAFSDLHEILPPTTKARKNSIVQSAATYVEALTETIRELQRRNEDLNAMLASRNEVSTDGAEIKLQVSNPSSAIDSMIAALECIKGMDLKARNICFHLSGQNLSIVAGIETELASADVERAVHGTLMEVEKKSHDQV